MKLGPPTLAAIAEERELTDDQHFAGDIGQREIHFALGVVKDAQLNGFVGQLLGVDIGVVLFHAE